MEKLFSNSLFRIAWLLIAGMVTFTACEKDDDDDDNGIPAEDGIYITGPASGFDGLVLEGMMDPGREEGEGFASNPRSGMFEKFLYLGAGNFSIVEKSGADEFVYGWKAGTQDSFDNEGEGDETDGPVHYGEFADEGMEFSVATAGFYHVILDKTTGMAYYTRISHWGLIGDATDQGWAAEYQMTETTLSATEAAWELTDLTLRERGGFKFRYNSGWKITTDDFIIFANIGSGDSDAEFITGGDVFGYPADGEGEYTVTLAWTIEDGFSFSTERTGDVEPLPEFPDALYMIGDGVGGWEWADIDLPMVPTAGNKDHLFWKIVWMEADGGFKFAPQREWAGDFGKTGDATDGVYEIGGDNIPVPGVAGYYMVVVNLETDQIAIADPLVYLIGETIDSWDTANPDALFTVDNDNEVITITRDLAAADLRIYAWFDAVEGWFTDWWQHEFIILDGEIEFRGRGDDQERVQVPAGNNKIDLNFRTGEGTITQP
ncbi:MAG: SusF/SusE family outer membrane protein [Marinilabiliales bacterium]|nr:MAG: SusF/SusE family outer membrane protein [Marinilabiliales bacterium]